MSVALQGAISQGILWGIMVLGVFITFRLLDIPDMTVDGSFALGGCVVAVLVVNAGRGSRWSPSSRAWSPAAVAGAVTGVLATVFEIPGHPRGYPHPDFSLWSINLRIMGKSNTPLLANETIFSRHSPRLTGLPTEHRHRALVGAVHGGRHRLGRALLVLWNRDRHALRATGNNEAMIRAARPVNTNATKMHCPRASPTPSWAWPAASSARARSTPTSAWARGAIVIGLAADRHRRGAGTPATRRSHQVRRAPGRRRRAAPWCYFLIRAVVAADGHGRQRHEAPLRRHRRACAVRARCLGAGYKAAQLVLEGEMSQDA